MFASEGGHSTCVSQLFVRSAKLNIQAYDGRTALFMASENDHADVVL